MGNSAVGVYSQGSGNPLVTRLNDGLQEPYTAGSAFDSSRQFLRDRRLLRGRERIRPRWHARWRLRQRPAEPPVAGLRLPRQPVRRAADHAYIAEFSKTGQFVQNIGPLATELSGDDWIALSPDDCTVYYTTEGSDILRYNLCTNQQLPNFNVQSFQSFDPSTGLPVEDFQLQILSDGDILVADSNADILLDPNGNVLQTYTCASLPGCQGSLFAISLDPDGNSFWTGDSTSGDIWKVDIASSDVLQQIDTNSGALYGLSVDDQIEVGAPAPPRTPFPRRWRSNP